MAETRALRDGVQEADVVGFKKLIIEWDNQVIIKVLLGTASTPWQISNIIRDVWFWLDKSNQVELRYI